MKDYAGTNIKLPATIATELKSIFNFFDFLVYEDRVVDMYPKNKFKISSRNDCAHDFSSFNGFSTRRNVSDVKLVLRDGELFVNPFVLASNSPVFEKMLKEVKNQDEKILTLQWKSMKEISMLLKYMTSLQNMTGGSIFRIN